MFVYILFKRHWQIPIYLYDIIDELIFKGLLFITV